MSLSNSQIDTIAKQVYRQFPEVKGAAPAIASMSAKTPGAAERFVLTFKGKGMGPGGRTIPRIVRVVADVLSLPLICSTR